MIGNAILDGFFENLAQSRWTLSKVVEQFQSLSLNRLIKHLIPIKVFALVVLDKVLNHVAYLGFNFTKDQSFTRVLIFRVLNG
jgi:hypothetical protein